MGIVDLKVFILFTSYFDFTMTAGGSDTRFGQLILFHNRVRVCDTSTSLESFHRRFLDGIVTVKGSLFHVISHS